MKFSTHTIIIDNYPHEGETLLYNTRTQAMVKIQAEFKKFIEKFDTQPIHLRGRYADQLKALHRMGILVQNEQEDMERLKAHLGQIKHGVSKKMLAITILTTYACNLKCVYCFQESSRTNVKMDFETSDHVMNWIKAKIEKFGYEELCLNFYGGEPLVNKPTLEYIAEKMKDWCHQRGLRFRFIMQTNGYLMTPELIDQYVKMGLNQVRISVDGVGEDHDRNRPLRKGGGTFDVIMKNIVACVDKVNIGISTGYEQGEVRHIERLLDYCEELGILDKLGRFIFSPIHPTLGSKDRPEMIQNPECMCNYDNDNLIQANKRINGFLEKKGLSSKSGMSTSVCPLTRESSGMTIDQHGDIYKCNSMLGHPELSVGNVRNNDYNEKHKEFINIDVWKQCPQDCTYMPMCSGGCRLSSFLRNKNFTTASCHKPYLNKMAPEMIKKNYEEIMAKKKEAEEKELVGVQS